jgi:hypothetical protein
MYPGIDVRGDLGGESERGNCGDVPLGSSPADRVTVPYVEP